MSSMTLQGKTTVRTAGLFKAGSGLLSLISGLLAAALILYSGYVLYDTFYTQEQALSSSNLFQYRPEFIDDEFVPLTSGSLAEINEDYRAWLTMFETGIDYAVLQGSDNIYYASHDAFGNTSLTGSIYLAAENAPDGTDSYNMIYGHHMDNQAMFGVLDNFLDESYFQNHRDGVLVMDGAVFDLHTFAVVTTNAYESEIYTTGDRAEEVVSYLQAARLGGAERTQVLVFDEAALDNIQAEGLKIAAMSTCANATTDGRLVVFSLMTERSSNIQTVTEENTDLISNENNTIEEITEEETIVTSEEIVEEIEDEVVPMAAPVSPVAAAVEFFAPRAGKGSGAWALVNLICLIVTVYLFLPILHLKDKYSRARKMRKYNKNQEYQYEVKRFTRRSSIGFASELIIAVAAIVLFVLTENMRLPMVLIDSYTPAMLVLLLACWIVDVRLMRYRDEDPEEAEAQAA